MPHKLGECIEGTEVYWSYLFLTVFAGKAYLQAATLLVNSANVLFDDSLLQIGALNDMRKDIVEQKNVMGNHSSSLISFKRPFTRY